MSSDTPRDDRCAAETRDGGYCENYPLENADRCRMHGGRAGAPDGNDNATTHGAFSEHFRADLTDAEARALEAVMSHLEAIEDERTLAAEVAAEALLKYKRSADDRFLREARQWMSEFNLMPNEDELNIGGSGGNPLNVVVERSQYDGDE